MKEWKNEDEIGKYQAKHGFTDEQMEYTRFGFCDKCDNILFIDRCGGGPFEWVLFDCPKNDKSCNSIPHQEETD